MKTIELDDRQRLLIDAALREEVNKVMTARDEEKLHSFEYDFLDMVVGELIETRRLIKGY